MLEAFGRIAATAQPHDCRHAGIIPAVNEAFLHELDELSLAHNHIREAQSIEFILMRKEEEVLANKAKRGLHKRREILGMRSKKFEKALRAGIFERLRTLGRPAIKKRRHLHFGFALSKLAARFIRLFKEAETTLVLACCHSRDERLCFLVLRRAQHRNDALERPVVEGALIFEFKRANRVRDVFERVLDRMRVGVHRIDAPLAARRMMVRESNSIDRRIAQIDVGTRHVDLCAKHHGAFRMLAVAHFAEEPQILFGRTIAIGGVLSRLLQRAAIFAHLIDRLFVHISVARLNKMLREEIHVLKVAAREVEIVFLPVNPVEAKPANAVENAIDIFLVFLHRIRVVKAHMAVPAVVARKTEIEADALGMADVEVSVRLRRETRADLRHVRGPFLKLLAVGGRVPAPVAGKIGALRKIFLNDVANEIGRTAGSRIQIVAHRVLPKRGLKKSAAFRIARTFRWVGVIAAQKV